VSSFVYRNQATYELLMLLLYRAHYACRYHSVAELIPAGASVLDVCCGPAVLYDRHLKKKYVSYTGLDVNDKFIAKARTKGIAMIHGDVTAMSELPRADIVVMQASLYHFLPNKVSSVVEKMLKAAKSKLIIAEPVRNLSSSTLGCLARLAQRHTDAGSGPCTRRFDEFLLASSMAQFASIIEGSFPIPGGRELVYVLRPGNTDGFFHHLRDSRLRLPIDVEVRPAHVLA
jgi:SAM-dependent methyltransferase